MASVQKFKDPRPPRRVRSTEDTIRDLYAEIKRLKERVDYLEKRTSPHALAGYDF